MLNQKKTTAIETLINSSLSDIAKNLLGVDLWSVQEEFLKAIDNPKLSTVAVASCHSSGKTYAVAVAILCYLLKNPYSLVICTAPTQRQVENQIFSELRQHYPKISKYLPDAQMLRSELRITDGWQCIGFTTKDAEKFQGWHREKMVIFVDEGSGVDTSIYQAIESVQSSGDVKLVITSNPTKNTGYYADLFRNPPTDSKIIKISAWDTPNFKINGIRSNSGLLKADLETLQVAQPSSLSVKFARDKLERWGADSSWYKVRVLGEFATEDADSLFNLDLVYDAIDEDIKKTRYSSLSVGIDPSAYGDDRFVCLLMKDNVLCGHLMKVGRVDTMIAVGEIVDWLASYPMDKLVVKVDVGGLGAPIVDRLKEVMPHAKIVGINSSNRANDPEKYLNLRAENYFVLRDAFKNGKIKINLPKEVTDDLIADLSSIRYEIVESSGKVKIISKRDIKKQTGGISPDFADALALMHGAVRTAPRINWIDSEKKDISDLIFASDNEVASRTGF